MPHPLEIPGRFNGPLESGNGGYVAGALAGLGDGPAEVSLRRPVPLDRKLEVRATGIGGLAAYDGEDLIVEAEPAGQLDLAPPDDPVTLVEATSARERYRGLESGPFARCFVCGRGRHDGLGVHAGPVEGRDLVASPWTPPAWAGDDEGVVRPEIAWAVLDCPTYFATYRDTPDPLPQAVLARFTARLDGPIRTGREHVVIGWPITVDGRKRQAGSAILTAEGETVAIARALLIAPREPAAIEPAPAVSTPVGGGERS